MLPSFNNPQVNVLWVVYVFRKGRSLHDMTLAEMDAIWDEGKAKGL